MQLRIVLSVICLATFFGLAVVKSQDKHSAERLTPAEIEALTPIDAGAGTSGVTGIKTRLLKGDPNRAGLYTIQLTVPANTRIEAHTHRDDRVATVISGTWSIGYGTSFDEKKLKVLPPGSFYVEPLNAAHFARTGTEPVVVQITGYGPTDTNYVEIKESK